VFPCDFLGAFTGARNRFGAARTLRAHKQLISRAWHRKHRGRAWSPAPPGCLRCFHLPSARPLKANLGGFIFSFPQVGSAKRLTAGGMKRREDAKERLPRTRCGELHSRGGLSFVAFGRAPAGKVSVGCLKGEVSPRRRGERGEAWSEPSTAEGSDGNQPCANVASYLCSVTAR
jgi:hypothetical protein